MKINLILLAAGNSSRFNGNKLLTNLKGKPLCMHIIDKVMEIKFNRRIIVTQYEAIVDLIKEKDIKVVMNREPEKGVSYSIKLALQECEDDCDGFIFMVCDQPFIRKETFSNMIEMFKEGHRNIICAAFDHVSGNPTLFSKKYRKELMNLQGDVGGKKIIKENPHDVRLCRVKDIKELFDIDTRLALDITNKNNFIEIEE